MNKQAAVITAAFCRVVDIQDQTWYNVGVI
nr:MAG TPA: hypothetical protein [Caudoviricetes sp.]